MENEASLFELVFEIAGEKKLFVILRWNTTLSLQFSPLFQYLLGEERLFNATGCQQSL